MTRKTEALNAFTLAQIIALQVQCTKVVLKQILNVLEVALIYAYSPFLLQQKNCTQHITPQSRDVNDKR